MKVGMVGLDTSHCVAFTRLLNDAQQEYHVPGAKVVSAFVGGSPLFSLSRDRVDGFARELAQTYRIALVESIEELVASVDAVLLESVDGRQHLEQFAKLASGKPVFIDKPFATSVQDARDIVRIADDTGTPLMSCSSVRYAAGIADLLEPNERAEACEAFGAAALLDDYPGLFWYGIHSTEILFAIMGPGCRAVRCLDYPGMDVVVGEWGDDRLGIVRGTRLSQGDFGCVVHLPSATRVGLASTVPPYYHLLLRRVIEFFRTGRPPIDIKETLGIVAFLEAAELSRGHGGERVETET